MATKTDGTPAPEPFSLSRWSRRKREVAKATSGAAVDAPAAGGETRALSPGAAPAAGAEPRVPPAPAGAPATAVPGTAPEALPPVEELTFDSNFAAFMGPKVDESTKRAALKKLFGNPHFNVMDGLDIYVGDYTQPDPMPEGMLEKLAKVYEAVVEAKPADGAVAVPDASAADPTGAPVPATTPAEPAIETGVEAEARIADASAEVPVAGAAPDTPLENAAASATTASAVHELPAHDLPAAVPAAVRKTLQRSVPE